MHLVKKSNTSLTATNSAIAKASVRSATKTIPAVDGSTRTSPEVIMPIIRLITDRILRARKSSTTFEIVHSRFR